ncbi:MAG: type II secretion system secretin GspD [Magnetococcales bacterium]|nr:type II secretion system secretin GspD [Magnetococcales bacterium]
MKPTAASWLPWILALTLGYQPVALAEPSTPTKPASPAESTSGTSNVTLNLKGADLETLVETVAKATGKNFVLDPKVQGKVTVVSHKPVSGDELYAIFLSILEVHGFMAVPVGNVIKILPDNDLKYQAEPDTSASGGSDEVVAQVFPLRFVDAGRIIPVLRPMLGPKAHMSAHPDTNSLVISGRSAEIARLEKLLDRVDRPFTETIETVALEHAKASDVHRIATELSKIMAPDNSQEKVVIVADERTNSILLGGQKDARLRMRMIIGKLDGAVEVSGNTRVIGLKYAKAEDLAKVLANMGENYLKDNKQENNKGNSLVNVQAYTGDNSLVISAPVDLLRSMSEVVRVLDRRRKQVQVKAIIAEVSNDKVAELGVQWGILAEGKDDKGVATGVNFPSANPGLVQLGIATQNLESKEALSVVNNVAGLLLGGTDGTNLIALLRALKSDADTNILSTPSIVTLDNEEAEIVVGQEVPFITSSSTNNAGNPFQTITRENVGLSLKVKPLITDGDTVRMDIDQEVSSLLPDAANVTLSDAVTRTRRIKTSVLVENQQILVLGGLIQNDLQQTTAKVPFLGDLPLLGVMFRAERSSDVKTNLMVFLRPQILHDPNAGDFATEESYRIIRGLQQELPPIRGPVKLDEAPPILPDWNDQLRLSRRVEASEIVQEDLPSPPVGLTDEKESSLKEQPVSGSPNKGQESSLKEPSAPKGLESSLKEQPAPKKGQESSLKEPSASGSQNTGEDTSLKPSIAAGQPMVEPRGGHPMGSLLLSESRKEPQIAESVKATAPMKKNEAPSGMTLTAPIVEEKKQPSVAAEKMSPAATVPQVSTVQPVAFGGNNVAPAVANTGKDRVYKENMDYGD